VELRRLDLSSNQILEFGGVENLPILDSFYGYNNPAYRKLTEVLGVMGPRQVLEHLRIPLEERILMQKSGPTYIPKEPGMEYCARCQKYTKPKGKFGATFCCAFIGLCIVTAMQKSRCSVCKKKFTGASPPSNVIPISPAEMNNHPISQSLVQGIGNIFCPNCGNPITSTEVIFCPNCGAQIKN